jgi:hypothetical protein
VTARDVLERPPACGRHAPQAGHCIGIDAGG